MSCYKLIIRVMRANKRPMFLYEIQQEIWQGFRQRYETTAISARIRDEVRKELQRNGRTVLSARAPGKAAHVYWIGKA